MSKDSRQPVPFPLGLALVLVLLFLAGCSGVARRHQRAYMAGTREMYFWSPDLLCVTAPQIERGTPRPVLDTVGWIIAIPDKILLWDRRIGNHKISPVTEAAVSEYLAVNQLDTVKVRLNQYAPLEDWRRLRANRAVGFGWKYSLGTLSCLGEAIFPGRVWGDDHYNPFTNTVHIFSDAPAIALHEAGHAKDFAGREYKGTYAALYLLPGVPLWHEAMATDDALDYLAAQPDPEAEAEGYRLLYPAYGTYVGDAAGYLAPDFSGPVYLGGVLIGHLVGRLEARESREVRVPVTLRAEDTLPPPPTPDP